MYCGFRVDGFSSFLSRRGLLAPLAMPFPSVFFIVLPTVSYLRYEWYSSCATHGIVMRYSGTLAPLLSDMLSNRSLSVRASETMNYYDQMEVANSLGIHFVVVHCS